MNPDTYISEANSTLPPEFHLDTLLGEYGHSFFDALVEFAKAAQRLNHFKKHLVYGREVPFEVMGLRDVNSKNEIPVQPDNVPLAVIHSIVGLSTEAGEMAEILITSLFGDDDFDITNLKEEYGGILWYIARGLKGMDLSFEEIMAANIAQLRVRHKSKGSNFNPDAVAEANRDKEAERAAIDAAQSSDL